MRVVGYILYTGKVPNFKQLLRSILMFLLFLIFNNMLASLLTFKLCFDVHGKVLCYTLYSILVYAEPLRDLLKIKF